MIKFTVERMLYNRCSVLLMCFDAFSKCVQKSGNISIRFCLQLILEGCITTVLDDAVVGDYSASCLWHILTAHESLSGPFNPPQRLDIQEDIEFPHRLFCTLDVRRGNSTSSSEKLQYITAHTRWSIPVRCPHCCSTQLYLEKRKEMLYKSLSVLVDTIQRLYQRLPKHPTSPSLP